MKSSKVSMYANKSYIGTGVPGGVVGGKKKKLSPNEYMQPGVNNKMKRGTPKTKGKPSKLKGTNTTLAYNANGYRGYHG